MSARRIRLTPSFQTYYLENVVDGFRITVVADSEYLMPSKIFAYRNLVAQPGASSQTAVFDHICSPADLEEYPEDSPAPNSTPGWFRTDFVDIVFRSRALAMAAWSDIRADVADLKASLDAMDVLTTLPPVWIGTPP